MLNLYCLDSFGIHSADARGDGGVWELRTNFKHNFDAGVRPLSNERQVWQDITVGCMCGRKNETFWELYLGVCSLVPQRGFLIQCAMLFF